MWSTGTTKCVRLKLQEAIIAQTRSLHLVQVDTFHLQCSEHARTNLQLSDKATPENHTNLGNMRLYEEERYN